MEDVRPPGHQAVIWSSTQQDNNPRHMSNSTCECLKMCQITSCESDSVQVLTCIEFWCSGRTLERQLMLENLSVCWNKKQFCKEERAKIPPQQCERFFCRYWKRGAFTLFFTHWWHVLGDFFPSTNDIFKKNAFCIYSGLLCLIFNFLWRLVKCGTNAKI